jgi:hypothetical protein
MNKSWSVQIFALATIVAGCSNPNDTKFTSSFCRTATDCTEYNQDVRFNVVQDKNLVVTQYYSENKVISSDFLKDCTILNEEHWACTSHNERLGYSYKIKRVGNTIETTDENIKFTKTK